MTATLADIRIRRPQQYEELIMELREGDAHFPTFRDILLLAGAIGFQQQRRRPFSASTGDPIRYEVLTQNPYSDVLISMVAANEVADDPEIMDDTRLEERVKIFEEYANGGLEFLQEQVNVRHQSAALVVIDLVTEALFRGSSGARPLSIEELLGGASVG